MKNVKKLVAIVLVVVMVLTISANVHGYDYETDVKHNYQRRCYTYLNYAQLLPRHMFTPVTGEVVSVTKTEWITQIRLLVGESYTDLNITDTTFIEGGFPETGDKVTGFYDTNSFMITIYPPQYNAEVIVNHESNLLSVFVGRFFGEGNHKAGPTDCGRELLSADGALRLNVNNPETVIVSQDGKDASDWDLDGRMLVVFYSVSTRSLPPLVFAPEKIVVMYEIAVHLPEWGDFNLGGYDEYDDELGWYDVGYLWGDEHVFHDIVINGVGLPGETFYSADGMFPTHVPIRAVAESLGITVDWHQPTLSVVLSGEWGDITFRFDSNEFKVNGETVTLSIPALSAPNGRVQVPLEFFRVIAGFENAWSAGGTVFINNFERME